MQKSTRKSQWDIGIYRKLNLIFSTTKTPYRIVFFLVLNCWMFLFLLICKIIPIPNTFFFSLLSFSFETKLLVAKTKYLHLRSQKWYWKNRENSNFIFYSLNLLTRSLGYSRDNIYKRNHSLLDKFSMFFT